MEKQLSAGRIKRHEGFTFGIPHYWFTVTARNGRILATSETYKTKKAMDKGIASLVKAIKCLK